MEDIDFSVEGVKVIFTPSDAELPEHLRKWALYDVYVEGEYAGRVTDTGRYPRIRASERTWRALEGEGYKVGDELSADEVAGLFVRWYYGARGGDHGE